MSESSSKLFLSRVAAIRVAYLGRGSQQGASSSRVRYVRIPQPLDPAGRGQLLLERQTRQEYLSYMHANRDWNRLLPVEGREAAPLESVNIEAFDIAVDRDIPGHLVGDAPGGSGQRPPGRSSLVSSVASASSSSSAFSTSTFSASSKNMRGDESGLPVSRPHAGAASTSSPGAGEKNARTNTTRKKLSELLHADEPHRETRGDEVRKTTATDESERPASSLSAEISEKEKADPAVGVVTTTTGSASEELHATDEVLKGGTLSTLFEGEKDETGTSTHAIPVSARDTISSRSPEDKAITLLHRRRRKAVSTSSSVVNPAPSNKTSSAGVDREISLRGEIQPNVAVHDEDSEELLGASVELRADYVDLDTDPVSEYNIELLIEDRDANYPAIIECRKHKGHWHKRRRQIIGNPSTKWRRKLARRTGKIH
ncbi:unnamed protein product [Amoebophrya sp. A25]|nr:unnamed protein product [Amoebophrya sp. A25]|eukprot:GSA25T00025277001.1